MPRLRFATLRPEDLAEIRLQPSQAQQGLFLPFDDGPEMAARICAQPVAWCAREGGRIVACFGIYEVFAGRQGVAWAMLADGIGYAHLELTRFIQTQIAGCGLARLELLTAAPDIEPEIGGLNALGRIRRAFRRATPEMRWAVLLGMEPAYLLRQFGPAGVTLMLFERIDPAAAPAMPEREAA